MTENGKDDIRQSDTGEQPSEEEIRAALEEEMRRVHVGDVLLQSVVSLINVGMRRTGLAPGTEAERDLGQTALAANSVSALLPAVEAVAPEQAAAVRDALSQLQVAFVKAGGTTAPAGGEGAAAAPAGPEAEPEKPASTLHRTYRRNPSCLFSISGLLSSTYANPRRHPDRWKTV